MSFTSVNCQALQTAFHSSVSIVTAYRLDDRKWIRRRDNDISSRYQV